MKIFVPFFSCDAAVSQCFGHMIPIYDRHPVACLPNAPYRYGETLVIYGKYMFGCHNPCSKETTT